MPQLRSELLMRCPVESSAETPRLSGRWLRLETTREQYTALGHAEQAGELAMHVLAFS